MNELLEELIDLCYDYCDFDLVKSAFIASGIKDRGKLKFYLERFNDLCLKISLDKRFITATTDVGKGQAIADYLWDGKPNRAERSNDEFGTWRLSEVLDNQLSDQEVVGNCVGLSVLYNSIANQLGLVTSFVETDNHTYTILESNKDRTVVENTVNERIGIRKLRGRIISDQKLIKKLLLRSAIYCERQGDYQAAFEYEKTKLMINPNRENAYYLIYLSEKLGNLDLAIKAYSDILNKHPDSPRIMAKLALSYSFRQKGGDIMRAMKLYKKAAILNPMGNHMADLHELRWLHPLVTIHSLIFELYNYITEKSKREVFILPPSPSYNDPKNKRINTNKGINR